MLTLKKKNLGFRNQVHEKTSLHLLLKAQDQRLGADQDRLPCGSTGTSPGNCLETETCIVLACHTPQQPLQNRHWRMGDAMAGRGNAGWTTSKNRHPCPCQNCSQGPPAEKTGRGSLLNRLSCLFDDPIGLGTELNISIGSLDAPSLGVSSELKEPSDGAIPQRLKGP